MIRVSVAIKKWGRKEDLPADLPPLFAPVPDTASTIGGTPEIGQTLTAASDGAWSGNPAPALARAWQRDGADIPGETGEAYLLAEADDRADVRLRVTATNSEGTATAFSPALAVTYPAPTVANGLPHQACNENSGVQTVPTAGGFAGDGLTFSLVSPPAGVTVDSTSGGVSIDTHATGPLSATIVVRATNSGGSAQSAFSLTVEAEVVSEPPPVVPETVAPTFTTPPTLSAERTAGQTVTCDPGTFTDTPTPVVSYQWTLDGEDITNETASAWEIRAGKAFACRVRLTSPGGSVEATTDSATIKSPTIPAPTPAPAGRWSVAELLGEAPLGRVAVTIGNIAVPSGHDLRVTSRISDDDAFSSGTTQVLPNTVYVHPAGVALGVTRYTKLWFRRIADEPNGVGSNPAAWFLATTEGVIETTIKHYATPTPPEPKPLIYTTAQLGMIGAAPNIDYGDNYGNSDFGAGTNGAYSGSSWGAAAMVSHYFGDTKLGTDMSDADVLKRLRAVIGKGAGNDPTMEGGYRLQYGCRTVVAIAFIRRTPRLWNALTTREKNCCDAIITGHLVCAATTGNDNSTIRDRDLRGKVYPSQPRSQNPNFSLNIPAALYAGVLYYGGASSCIDILEAFDVSDFRALLGPAQLDLRNAYKTYTYRTGGFERSGTAPTDTQIEAACRNFVFYGRKLGDAAGFAQFVIDENMKAVVIEGVYHNGKPYPHRQAALPEDGKYGIPVKGADTTKNRRGRTENNSMANPWRGQTGMFEEFWSRDGEGVRSSASYVVQGVRCQMDFAVCALAASVVDRGNPVWRTFAQRMEVGMGDLWYKYVNGYRSLAKNNTVSNNEDFGPGWSSSEISGFGTAAAPGYFFGTYDRIIKPHLGIVK